MSFLWNQIIQVRSGGMPLLWGKIRAFPGWALHGFATSKRSRTAACYLLRIAVFLWPRWAEAHAQLAETLISLQRFDDAFATWESAFLLKPDSLQIQYKIQNAFYFSAQTRAAQIVMQRYLDAQNSFAREHQLDKLGLRFLSDFPTAIGHIAMLDSYIKMGILGQRSPARPIVLAAAPANKCYMDYWRRYLPDMITDPLAIGFLLPFAKYLEDHMCAVMDSSGKQIYEYYTSERAIQEQWQAEGRGPLLTLNDTDNERGRQCLRDLGVLTDAWFVGLHVRYGGEKLRGARDADINTFRLAMKSIAERGGWVIRMGDTTMPPLPPMPKVIDYAHSAVRSDWMDVFLWAKCRFFIGTNSGPITVPPTFGVPCVITNWSSLGLRLWFNKDLCIFKLHWSKSEARYLNFAEVTSSALAWSESTDYLTSQGIKLVDNTSEEINAVVIEMLDRLDGKLQYSRENEELQERFDNLYISDACKANARIGRDFLRKWAHLL